MTLQTYTKNPDLAGGFLFGDIEPEALDKMKQNGTGRPGAGYDPLVMAQDMLAWSDLVVLKGDPEAGTGTIESYRK